MPLVITQCSPISLAGVRKKNQLLRNQKRQELALTLATYRFTVCMLLFFFCSLHAQYMSMCANLSTDWRLSVLVLVLATNIAHSLTCFFSVRFAFCRIFCCCYLYLLCCTFLLSARCLFFSVLFALTASLPSLLTYFPLLIGLLFLPLTQSFSFYDFQLFSYYHCVVVELVAQSKNIFHQLMLAVKSGKFL